MWKLVKNNRSLKDPETGKTATFRQKWRAEVAREVKTKVYNKSRNERLKYAVRKVPVRKTTNNFMWG